ncbi:MAG: outer membrane lipoprotein carrier protein LolA [Nitrospirota bacterium]|nr:MAG: outer membrane lipoprotein carrier protein LolA [Nitrospirota bacterium]
MRKIYIRALHIAVIALIITCAPALAANNAELDKLIEKQKEIRSLSADFVQEKHSEMLAEPMISKGKFYYMSPSKVAWIYPEEAEVISNGTELLIHYPQIKEAEIIPLKESLLSLPLNFNIDELKKFFNVDIESSKERHKVTLVPIDNTSMFSRMLITFKVSGEPLLVEIFEKGGDKSTIKFNRHKTNENIKDRIFDPKLPEGTEIRRSVK